MSNAAAISDCGRYRYHLSRDLFAGELPMGNIGRCVFVMLNPSTADATEDDQTVRKCMGFAKRNACSELAIVNLYALRATDPGKLIGAPNPVGVENDAWITESVIGAKLIVAAWGSFPYERMPSGKRRADHVASLLRDYSEIPVMCLKKSKGGFPYHPLYLPYETQLSEWWSPDGRSEFRHTRRNYRRKTSS